VFAGEERPEQGTRNEVGDILFMLGHTHYTLAFEQGITAENGIFKVRIRNELCSSGWLMTMRDRCRATIWQQKNGYGGDKN
jgi:hypothetical protein